ncbi:MAG: amidase [Acidobacteria bacterium]|nr:amidase [Candidatus Sulfomarinibacter kjeldsenii]
MYIERLKRYDATLHCVITLTEERALAQAQRTDRELAEGRYRGPLHGIPWGAKDLFAVRGYPTTWGATPFKEQQFDEDATVVRRLDAAGAVLVAKLTMGALANGDVWFGGKTRNPWNTEEGSRGSSAGSSAADPKDLRVGYLSSAFMAEPSESQREWHEFNLATLEAVRSMGIELVPLELPEVPISALGFILRVEAAAAFDEMTRTNVDDTLVRQDPSAWPNRFRTARAVPAVEYIQANRVRRIAMREMARNLEGIDVYLSPTRGDNLRITNLTGHPAVVVPNGFRANGTPTSVTFCGNLYRDSEAMLLARAYQEATGFHLRHPSM